MKNTYFLNTAWNIFLIFLSLYFFISPAIISILYIRQIGNNTGIPKFVFKHHENLTNDYDKWLDKKLSANDAYKAENIPDTEWPLFSTVFYLWTTENLQNAWEENNKLYLKEPKKYSKNTLEKAVKFILDEKNATWVKNYWGESYLDKQNLFYRMLQINGLLSYQIITKDSKYEKILKNQIDKLASEVDGSKYGILYDYPNECYPIDLIPALYAIKKSDTIFKTDHSQFINRSYRAFEGKLLDKETGLPSYVADPETGMGVGSARGVEISLLLNWIGYLWPDKTDKIFQKYDKYFIERNLFITGIREYSKGIDIKSFISYDVDAGPILFNLGTTASTFGISAANNTGRMFEAFELKTEAIVASWPIPGKILLIPRLISSLTDAPLTGDSLLLYNFSHPSNANKGELFTIPLIVVLTILFQMLLGSYMIYTRVKNIWQKIIL